MTLRFPLLEIANLDADEVHVWKVRMDLMPLHVPDFWLTLSVDEKSRAEGLTAKQSERFIIGRGALRVLLGEYMQVDPSELRFRYNSYGKPFLDQKSGRDLLYFNLSHSESIALFAVTLGREIGVDIECIRSGLNYNRIAERFFSPCEAAKLLAFPKCIQEEAFFSCWTRKEAYVKARGQGLTIPLDRFEVSVAPGEATALFNVKEHSKVVPWTIHTFIPNPGYVGSIAIEGHGLKLSHWDGLL